jgi:hypothetical protein
VKKVLFLTSIVPSKENKGGPSGLIYELILLFEKFKFITEVEVHTKQGSFLNKMGIYYSSKKVNSSNYDFVFVYPFNLVFLFDFNDFSNVNVIGPDSPSLLFRRFYRNETNFFKKIKYFILQHWFKSREFDVLSRGIKLAVVGKNDARWLKRSNPNLIGSIFYITHPVLSVFFDKFSLEFSNNSVTKKTLVFSGDLSKKYLINNYINIFICIGKLQKEINFNVLFVGKNSRWLFNEISQANCLENIEYIEWIADYADLCNPLNFVHFFPLGAGAGTKNRTLSAMSFGTTIVGSFVSLENTLYHNYYGKVFSFRGLNCENALKSALTLSSKSLTYDRNSRVNFFNHINEKFKNDVIKLIGVDID